MINDLNTNKIVCNYKTAKQYNNVGIRENILRERNLPN